jgi:methyltransferase (TIGR00027 family)
MITGRGSTFWTLPSPPAKGLAMQIGQFSRAAIGAARHRAAHQVLEKGSVFSDPLARGILGLDAETLVAEDSNDPRRRGLRLFIAARSRIAEDAARRAIAGGLRQVVVLGAGLDTFAYRCEVVEGLRIFEVDHPATQAEKRRRLAEAGIAIPDALTFISHDFEATRLVEALERAGYDSMAPGFFIWLGVTPYLSEAAISATLADLALLPGGAEVAFDYVNPPDTIAGAEARAAHEALAARVAAAGEPLRASFDSGALHALLSGLGFGEIKDHGPADIATRFTADAARLRDKGAHVVVARRG